MAGQNGRALYHLWLSPFCRKIRLQLAEKGLETDLRVEKIWERRQGFLALNPAGDVPVLIEPDGTTLVESAAIVEYLEEVYPDSSDLLGDEPVQRAEVRRLMGWFDRKFYDEVTEKLVGEKLMKRLYGEGGPDSAAVRAGSWNIHHHLDYIGFLADRRNWLGGDSFSLADIAAGAQLSCVDYIGDVPWDDHPAAKMWYQRLKSRPSFRPLLADRIPGAPPPAHYGDLDF